MRQICGAPLGLDVMRLWLDEILLTFLSRDWISLFEELYSTGSPEKPVLEVRDQEYQLKNNPFIRLVFLFSPFLFFFSFLFVSFVYMSLWNSTTCLYSLCYFYVNGQTFQLISVNFLCLSERFWYCRLSPNLKFLHYGDCQEGQEPSLENLPNKCEYLVLSFTLIGVFTRSEKDKR